MTDAQSTPDQDALAKIDSSVPHSARIWNYWMGGKDNYEVDRIAGDAYRKTAPNIVDMARASRAYLIRAVTFLTAEAGIRQFLDIGTGLPTYDNTHQVAQRIAPESRIVYVDNDPLVLAHARALLTSTPEGVTTYLDADLRDPDHILEEAKKTLDFSKPIGLMLMGILGHIPDFEQARSIVRKLHDALPSGSYFVHYDGVGTNQNLQEAQDEYDQTGADPYALRSVEELTQFYEGLEVLEPGIVSCPLWRPDPADGDVKPTDIYGGVARKP